MAVWRLYSPSDTKLKERDFYFVELQYNLHIFLSKDFLGFQKWPNVFSAFPT